MPKFISDDEMNKIESSAPKAKGFLSEAEMAQMEADTPSELDSLARGAAQGASFGFADELAGGTGALIRKALGDKADLMDIYEEERNDSRNKYKVAEQTNPKSYVGGQVGGAVGTALIPGLGGANLAKLGALGAAQGLGSSEADLLKGDVAGAARDTAIGGGVGLATGGIMKGLSSLAPSAERVAGGLINTAEDVASPLANLPGRSHTTIPGKMFGASNYAEQVASSIGNIPERLGTGLREAGAGAAKAAETGELSQLVKSAGSLIRGGTGGVGQVAESVMGATAPKVPNSLGQRTVDTALGALAIPGKSVILPTAATAKVASGALGAANRGISKVAGVLSAETIPTLAPKLGRYGKVLTDAAARGGESLGATHFILQQTDPAYRELYTKAIQDDEE